MHRRCIEPIGRFVVRMSIIDYVFVLVEISVIFDFVVHVIINFMLGVFCNSYKGSEKYWNMQIKKNFKTGWTKFTITVTTMKRNDNTHPSLTF